ncbi:MAG: ABC transporter ATP-binding protein [Christensenellales bacterium]
MEPIICARGLTKIYRIEKTRLKALDNVDLDIGKGEFCCIVGTSGSGKSTLLNLLAGIEPATRGSIEICGKTITGMNESGLVRFRLKHIGFVFQSFNLLQDYNAMENIAMPLSFRGVPRYIRNKRAMRLLKSIGLKSHARHKPSQLSGGQQQRVSIARALSSQPDIIFADEPTGNLDSKTSKEIMDFLMKATKEGGKTLVMVTHDIENAKHADKVVRLLDGRIISIDQKAKTEGREI